MVDNQQMTFDFSEVPRGVVTRSKHPVLNCSVREPLFDKAHELVIRHGRCSPTFLQRKLGVNWLRCANIARQLADARIIYECDTGYAVDVSAVVHFYG